MDNLARMYCDENYYIEKKTEGNENFCGLLRILITQMFLVFAVQTKCGNKSNNFPKKEHGYT